MVTAYSDLRSEVSQSEKSSFLRIFFDAMNVSTIFRALFLMK